MRVSSVLVSFHCQKGSKVGPNWLGVSSVSSVSNKKEVPITAVWFLVSSAHCSDKCHPYLKCKDKVWNFLFLLRCCSSGPSIVETPTKQVAIPSILLVKTTNK